MRSQFMHINEKEKKETHMKKERQVNINKVSINKTNNTSSH